MYYPRVHKPHTLGRLLQYTLNHCSCLGFYKHHKFSYNLMSLLNIQDIMHPSIIVHFQESSYTCITLLTIEIITNTYHHFSCLRIIIYSYDSVIHISHHEYIHSLYVSYPCSPPKWPCLILQSYHSVLTIQPNIYSHFSIKQVNHHAFLIVC